MNEVDKEEKVGCKQKWDSCTEQREAKKSNREEKEKFEKNILQFREEKEKGILFSRDSRGEREIQNTNFANMK